MLTFTIIIGSLILEVTTVIDTIMKAKKGIYKAFLKVANDKYKMDYEVVNQIFKEEIKKRKKGNKFFKNLILFIPLVNLLTVTIDNAKLQKKIINNERIKATLIPLNSYELEKLKEQDKILSKFGYVTYLKSKEQNFVKAKEIDNLENTFPVYQDSKNSNLKLVRKKHQKNFEVG